MLDLISVKLQLQYRVNVKEKNILKLFKFLLLSTV